jgi:4-amino-4-deoxy-L-arabinose transferase-like glycosyltransferase
MQSQAVSKRAIFLAIPVLLSVIIVFWNLTALGLSHWDEYNYIETAEWFLHKPGAAFTIYEPPGFPLLVAIFFKLFGVRDYAAIAVSGVFAVATVALVAYVGLRLFRLEVGLTAPILLVIMPLFITYSRMALTDAAFMFFYSLALVTMYVAVKADSTRTIAVAGVALGACAMVKYNGFMALLVVLFYSLIALKSVPRAERLRTALRQLRVLALTCLPTLVLGLLFISLLGLSTKVPENRLLSFHALKLMALDAPTILSEGLAKFGRAAVFYHSGQLGFFPLITTAYYLQVLAYFVPIPLLLLAIVGLLRKNLHDGPELFVAVWFLGTFVLIASIAAQYSRAILPALPALALCASLGLSKITAVVESSSFGQRPRITVKALAPLLLIAVLLLGLQGALQAVSVEHHGYRDASSLLANAGQAGPVLADTQLVIGFYYPVNFGRVNNTTLSNNRYLVVDFIAEENGYVPTIQQLTAQGRLKLIGTIPADLPPEVYLDWVNFQQLGQWNYTYIQVYEITNSTAPAAA